MDTYMSTIRHILKTTYTLIFIYINYYIQVNSKWMKKK